MYFRFEKIIYIRLAILDSQNVKIINGLKEFDYNNNTFLSITITITVIAVTNKHHHEYSPPLPHFFLSALGLILT